MAQIHNTQTLNEVREGGKLQQSREIIPSQLAEKVVPVMEVNPKLMRRINIMKFLERTATSAGTIYTTPTDKDFLLVAIQMSERHDAAYDGTRMRINFTLDDGSAGRIDLKLANGTIGSTNQVIDLPIPMKLARGSTIQVDLSFTAGTQTTHTAIFGYIIDNSNA